MSESYNRERAEEIIGYRFSDESLLFTAFSHSSYANEHNLTHNERLEFLGDAVLEIVISEWIYKNHPKMSEGDMSRLRASYVREETLSDVMRQFHLNKYLMMGNGEEQSGGRERSSIIADAFEAIVGAVFLDGGLEPAKKFILGKLSEKLRTPMEEAKKLDYKTFLQEYIQQSSTNPITYSIYDEQGPSHDKTFYALVRINARELGRGKGKSKKEAEQNAALDATQKLGILKL
ncbi:ribonuclease 3 [Clostridia bacterium]|nr:ribonuclease 3 [Clostridia bacterium]